MNEETRPAEELARSRRWGFAGLAMLLAVLLASLVTELFCRVVIPRPKAPLPPEQRYQPINHRRVIVSPELGMIFKPYGKVISSNGFDYRVEQQVNRYGFLDRDFDCTIPAEPGVKRILFIGDSYVEAVQVPLEKKIQTLTMEILNQQGVSRVETMALGFSGMGTSNELLFYEKLGRKFKPDVVVLVFIANDFANNSPTLQAINEGWHPECSPRFFIELDHRTNEIKTLPVALNHDSRIMPVKQPKPTPPPEPWLLDGALGWSEAYRVSTDYLRGRASRNIQSVKVAGVFEQRIEFLRKDEFYRRKLEGYRYPDDLSMDHMFHVAGTDVPQVFLEAYALTDLAISNLSEFVHRDGGKLVILADAFLRAEEVGDSKGRTVVKGEAMRKLQSIGARRKVPIVDLYEEFERRGGFRKTSWSQDAHWNELGHLWSAEALAAFIIREGWLSGNFEK